MNLEDVCGAIVVIMGIRGKVSRSTMADANERRDWRIYADFTRLYTLQLFRAYFVIRARSNLQFRRIDSRPFDKSTGLRCD